METHLTHPDFMAAKARLKSVEERLSILQKQIDVLKEHSHEHGVKGMTYPYNPDYEPVNCKTICDACGEYDYECKCDDKPSEFISIRRDVAERWMEYQHADDVKTKITRWDASTNLAKEIRKGLI